LKELGNKFKHKQFSGDGSLYNIALITLFGTIVCGVGTSLGAILATCFKKSNNTIMSSIIGIAGGLMLSIVTFDLIPEAILKGGLSTTLAGVVIGILFVTIIDILLPHTTLFGKAGKSLKTGLILVIGLAAHNFPEGLAIGSGFVGTTALGIELSIVIGLHDVPEGAAVAAAFMTTRLSRIKIILLTAVTAIPTAIGAFVGAAVGEISTVFITVCLGFAGGTMLYIVCGELIPQSKSISKGILSTLSILIGIILGLMITAAI
jgi:zinc transporter, ZIP family